MNEFVFSDRNFRSAKRTHKSCVGYCTNGIVSFFKLQFSHTYGRSDFSIKVLAVVYLERGRQTVVSRSKIRESGKGKVCGLPQNKS